MDQFSIEAHRAVLEVVPLPFFDDDTLNVLETDIKSRCDLIRFVVEDAMQHLVWRTKENIRDAARLEEKKGDVGSSLVATFLEYGYMPKSDEPIFVSLSRMVPEDQTPNRIVDPIYRRKKAAIEKEWLDYRLFLLTAGAGQIAAHNDHSNRDLRDDVLHVTWKDLWSNRVWRSLGVDKRGDVRFPVLGKTEFKDPLPIQFPPQQDALKLNFTTEMEGIAASLVPVLFTEALKRSSVEDRLLRLTTFGKWVSAYRRKYTPRLQACVTYLKRINPSYFSAPVDPSRAIKPSAGARLAADVLNGETKTIPDGWGLIRPSLPHDAKDTGRAICFDYQHATTLMHPDIERAWNSIINFSDVFPCLGRSAEDKDAVRTGARKFVEQFKAYQAEWKELDVRAHDDHWDESFNTLGSVLGQSLLRDVYDLSNASADSKKMERMQTTVNRIRRTPSERAAEPLADAGAWASSAAMPHTVKLVRELETNYQSYRAICPELAQFELTAQFASAAASHLEVIIDKLKDMEVRDTSELKSYEAARLQAIRGDASPWDRVQSVDGYERLDDAWKEYTRKRSRREQPGQLAELTKKIETDEKLKAIADREAGPIEELSEKYLFGDVAHPGVDEKKARADPLEFDDLVKRYTQLTKETEAHVTRRLQQLANRISNSPSGPSLDDVLALIYLEALRKCSGERSRIADDFQRQALALAAPLRRRAGPVPAGASAAAASAAPAPLS